MNGKKTYIIAIVGFAVAVLSGIYQQMTGAELIPPQLQNELYLGVGALIAATIRHSIGGK